MKIRFLLGIGGWLFSCHLLIAQVPEPGFQMKELSLKHRFDSIVKIEDDSLKASGMKSFQKDLSDFLQSPAVYNWPFDSLRMIGKVRAPDDAFRIFTWNILMGSESTLNFGIIQMNPQKEPQCAIYLLKDQTDPDSVINSRISTHQWYGALYYKIILNNAGDKKYYTLLGFDSFSPYVSKKMIDVLTFDRGIPMLGASVFQVNGKLQQRVVFSYSAHVSMMLNYDEKTRMILYDHLSPTEDRYIGQYEYYGPDFSYDGYVFGKSFWEYVPTVNSIDPRKGKTKSRK